MADPTLIRIAPLYRLANIVYPFAGAVRGKIRPALVGPVLEHFRGAGYVAGTVTVEGAAASRPVRLYDRVSGTLVAETRSAADGSYRFDGVAAEREFLVLAHDDEDLHNAAPADRIAPAVE